MVANVRPIHILKFAPKLKIFSFFNIRVNCPVPVHIACSHSLGIKNLPVQALEVLETCIMA